MIMIRHELTAELVGARAAALAKERSAAARQLPGGFKAMLDVSDL